jgi:hypothetical protein
MNGNDFTAYIDPFLTYSYMPDDSLFGFSTKLMFSFYRFADMVTPAGQNEAFEVVEGDAQGIILKELSLDFMFRWDDDNQKFHIITGFPNLRPFSSIDASSLGDTPWWYGTRDIAGSQRPLAAMLRYENNWDNGSSVGVQAFVGSGKTSLSLDDIDGATVVDGANVGGAVSGQLALDPVILSLIAGGNYIASGSRSGDSSFTGDVGLLYNINDNHSLGVGFRYERNSFGGLSFNELTPSVNYHGVLYDTPNFQDELNINLSYLYSDREMTIGGDDPGNDCTGPDVCPTSMNNPLPQAGLGIAAINRFDLPWFYIDVGAGLMISGQGNDNLGIVPVLMAGFGINHDFLGGNAGSN